MRQVLSTNRTSIL